MHKKKPLSIIDHYNTSLCNIPGIFKSGLCPNERVYKLLGFNDSTLYSNDISTLDSLITSLVLRLKESILKKQDGNEMIQLGKYLLEISADIKLYLTHEQIKEYNEIHNNYLIKKLRKIINQGNIIEYRNGKETALLSIYIHIISIIDMLIERSQLLTLHEIEYYGERLIFLGGEIININSLPCISESEQI